MCMIIYPTLTRYSICDWSFLRPKISAILSKQYEFIIKNIICNIVLYPICPIIGI